VDAAPRLDVMVFEVHCIEPAGNPGKVFFKFVLKFL
jgi:hypothetical protein